MFTPIKEEKKQVFFISHVLYYFQWDVKQKPQKKYNNIECIIRERDHSNVIYYEIIQLKLPHLQMFIDFKTEKKYNKNMETQNSPILNY